MKIRSTSGMALFSVLAVTAGIAIIGATAYTLAKTDIGIARNHREETKAIYQADAGLQYVKTQIEAALANGTINITNSAITTLPVYYSAPSGYTFDPVTNITRLPNGSFSFGLTGRASGAVARVTAVFQRKKALAMGVFGQTSVLLDNGTAVYSYYSSQFPGNPTSPSNSNHQADAGTDGSITTYNNSTLDGSLLLGASASGVTATWSDPGAGSLISGTPGSQVGYVNPDPLGISGGMLASNFIAVATANNNASAIPPIIDHEINVGNNGTLTLPPGNYYVTDVTMNNSANLIIPGTNGVVNLYIASGTANISINAKFAINGAGKPTGLNIYCNGTGQLNLNNAGTFSGLLYAPYAKVNVMNSGNFYGAIWGDQVNLKNSGMTFIDLDLLNKFQLNKIQYSAWKQNRASS